MKITDFPLESYDKIRYRDTDKQGHVNNANFSTFFETGRVELLYLPVPLHDKDATFVIANISLDYISEITWPGTVKIGTAITKIGNSSIGMTQAIFQNDQIVAKATTVIVQMNIKTRKSQPLSIETKHKLEQYKKITS